MCEPLWFLFPLVSVLSGIAFTLNTSSSWSIQISENNWILSTSTLGNEAVRTPDMFGKIFLAVHVSRV